MEFELSLIGLFLSFLFAGSETAFLTTNKIKIEIWVRNKIRSAFRAQLFYQKPERFISTTLVGNNIANVLATTYATLFLLNFVDELSSWIIITITVLLVGEIIPKVLFRTYSNQLILILVYIIDFFYIILTPVILTVNWISTGILKILGIENKAVKTFFSKEDVTLLLNEGRIAGLFADEEHKLITRVLELSNIQVKEAMVPRTLIQAIPDTSTIRQVKTLIKNSGFTKIPVYHKTIDNITGVVFMYDLFNKVTKLSEIIKPVHYSPLNVKCNLLLKEFKRKNISISIVLDEFGGTAGLVTMEDLAEELFGEFEENPVAETSSIKRLNRNTWRVDANEEIDVINEYLNLNIPPGEYETIAGYILYQLGYIPKSGDQLNFENYKLIISKSSFNKIEKIRIVKI